MKVLKRINTTENIKKLSIFLILISFFLIYYKNNIKQQSFQLNYELINIKDMAITSVPKKKKVTSNEQANSIFQIYKQMKTGQYKSEDKLVGVSLPTKTNTVATLESPKQVWYLPTEMGTLTSSVTASHFALDITSPKGQSEAIYPIANGVISSIYRDSAGAK